MKLKTFVIVAVVFGLLFLGFMWVMLAGASGVGEVSSPTATVEPRPDPPAIFTYGFPPEPEMGGEPAECAGVAGCGVMCYVVNEGAGQYELSCLPFVFESGK